MLTVILGVATGLVYGFADFFGAISSRKLRPILVTAVAGWVGLTAILLLTAFGALHANYSPGSLFWGGIAGLFSALGLACLYQALAIGPISILSPLAAVVGAIVPAFIGPAILGERFSSLGWLAIALVILAIPLVAYHPDPSKAIRPSARGIGFAVGAGVGIGGVLVCLHMAPIADGVAAATLTRAENVLILGLVTLGLLITKRAKLSEFREMGAGQLWLAIAATGVLDAAANVMFVYGSGLGGLTTVSVLTSLYPLGTIVLARIVLKEKLAVSQAAGILLALGASVLLAL
jgi:drug/metabolite transporter (DMT)-like permease